MVRVHPGWLLSTAVSWLRPCIDHAWPQPGRPTQTADTRHANHRFVLSDRLLGEVLHAVAMAHPELACGDGDGAEDTSDRASTGVAPIRALLEDKKGGR